MNFDTIREHPVWETVPPLAAMTAVGALLSIIFLLVGGVWFADSWLVSVFRKGGPVMWPILFCSILAVAICLERAYSLRNENIVDPSFAAEVRRLSAKGDLDRALKICANNPSAMARILKAGLNRASHGILEIERAIEAAGSHEATLMEANLRGLGVLANITPMMGLLGTVIGMIKAFDVISVAGSGNPSLVASGIAEALITTATGLIIGIPALAAYHYFRGRVDKFIYDMEEESLFFVEDLIKAMENFEATHKVADSPHEV
ncbi:MAG: MotA/TolQ/ExbB proton channel family protein [Nitrospinota bacterium]|nr:MotA/TolQ/ExbB proton channel family protein [Nitrospinota bacterium]MDH5677159.1 MotA/TolQ/ExbB proton channel family protein [Nitrospinota bacterium]MDH5757148.1 MotA/TolQ/ExbB proton channel family protein [Nitrospinota bacterium]